MTSQTEMEAAFEALLFIATEPVGRNEFLALFPEDEGAAAAAALEAVLERYREREGRGVMLDEVAGGLRLVTRPELHAYLASYLETAGRSRISMAALETLAIVAYRQPVTAPEIQDLRGVRATSVLRTLLENRLIRIAGRKEVVGRPFLYRTTREFLLRFGLNRLQDLPPLEEFEELLAADVRDEIGSDESRVANARQAHDQVGLFEVAVLEEEQQEITDESRTPA